MSVYPYTNNPMPYPEQPIVQQPFGASGPMPHNQTTVVHIGAANPNLGPGMGVRPWSTGLCGCCEDCGICALTFFCPSCALCCLANDMGENLCLSLLICLMGGWAAYNNNCCPSDPITLAMLRGKMRTLENIQGDLATDYFLSCCCFCCSLCQVQREMKRRNQKVLTAMQ